MPIGKEFLYERIYRDLLDAISAGTYRAARELLIRRGYKNLCFVSHSSVGTPTIRERYEGFVDGIVDVDGVKGRVVEISGYHPAPENEAEEYTDFDFSEIREAVRENIDRIIQGENVKGNICVPFRIIDPENDI